MKANASNIKDVSKYYERTYIIVPEISPKHVMLLSSVSNKGMVLRDSRDNQQGLISFDGGFEYEIQSPLTTRKAWFMHDNHAYLISRIPARMWRKGISQENTAIFRLTTTNEFVGCSVSDGLLNAFLQYKPSPQIPPAPSMQVFSKEWAFNGKTNMLFLWNTPVARWSRRTNELFVPKELKELTMPQVMEKAKVKYV